MKEVEAYAKKKTPGFDDNTRAWYCLPADVGRLRARIERACNAIVARDGIESKCTRLAMIAGVPKLGTHDLYELAMKLSEDPIQWESVVDPPVLAPPRRAHASPAAGGASVTRIPTFASRSTIRSRTAVSM
jgi:hypothetical protein